MLCEMCQEPLDPNGEAHYGICRDCMAKEAEDV
jgi:hypothetical protein